MKSIYKNLKAARQSILDYGWVQHDMGNSARGYCALGAVCSVGGDSVKLVDYLRKAIGLNMGSVMNWNDSPVRTKEEVVAAFTKAMRLAR
jgi:hypothetical protein